MFDDKIVVIFYAFTFISFRTEEEKEKEELPTTNFKSQMSHAIYF